MTKKKPTKKKPTKKEPSVEEMLKVVNKKFFNWR